MNLNNKKYISDKLGSLSEILIFLMAFLYILILLSTIGKALRQNGFFGVAIAFTIMYVVYLLSNKIYSTYEYHTQYYLGEISLKSYKKHWYISLFISLFIVIISFGVSFLFLIPNFIILYKTNYHFIKPPKYFSGKINFDKINKTLSRLDIIDKLVVSIIIGVAIGLTFGNLYKKFNYIVAVSMMIISSGLTFLYLKHRNFNQNEKPK